ncbi:hypothetical protein DPSP01_009022 [Paraphaeosphaeria sporulosa]
MDGDVVTEIGEVDVLVGVVIGVAGNTVLPLDDNTVEEDGVEGLVDVNGGFDVVGVVGNLSVLLEESEVVDGGERPPDDGTESVEVRVPVEDTTNPLLGRRTIENVLDIELVVATATNVDISDVVVDEDVVIGDVAAMEDVPDGIFTTEPLPYNCMKLPPPQFWNVLPVQLVAHLACGTGTASSRTLSIQHSRPYSNPKYE